MPTETDIKLRSRLDTNQREREQMCRAILALDRRYTEVRPRHPLGGPDGGRDIEAVFETGVVTFGAVGFVNSANDSNAQKREIRSKFTLDLSSATSAQPAPKAFVFFTNVHLAVGEQDKMRKEAFAVGIEHCDILDRERLRIELDSPSGFFIRFQYLGIALSEAEQASFLARYGDDIQKVVTTGFEKIEKTLDRIHFLSEARDQLDTLTFRFVLKRPYPALDIGHFRAFALVNLKQFKPTMATFWFGSTDKANRFSQEHDGVGFGDEPGIAHGTSSGQWERHLADIVRDCEEANLPVEELNKSDLLKNALKYRLTGSTMGAGLAEVRSLTAQYRHAETRFISSQNLALRDLDNGIFLPFLNASLAGKIHSVQVYANGYKLVDVGPDQFEVDHAKCGENLPTAFSVHELTDPWVRIRPSNGNSVFSFRFSETTPIRVLGHERTSDSPPPIEMS